MLDSRGDLRGKLFRSFGETWLSLIRGFFVGNLTVGKLPDPKICIWGNKGN